MATRQDFETGFRLLLGHEGDLSMNPQDPGNYTGPNRTGQLKGTRWGISARSYPHLDIANLDQAAAHDIYFGDFWLPVCADLPPRTAFVHFDAAVNNGPARAVRWLQQAVGVTVDGRYGPQTRAAAQQAAARNEAALLVEYQAHRLRFMCELKTWPTFRGGWSRRLVKVMLEAADYWPLASPQ